MPEEELQTTDEAKSGEDLFFRIETVTAEGRTASIMAAGPPLSEKEGLGRQIIEKLKGMCAPLRIVKEGKPLRKGEASQTLRDNDIVIIIDLNPSVDLSGDNQREREERNDSGLKFPEVIYWSDELGIPASVIHKGARQERYTLDNLMAELGYR